MPKSVACLGKEPLINSVVPESWSLEKILLVLSADVKNKENLLGFSKKKLNLNKDLSYLRRLIFLSLIN